jgi:hypothetical protein
VPVRQEMPVTGSCYRWEAVCLKPAGQVMSPGNEERKGLDIPVPED